MKEDNNLMVVVLPKGRATKETFTVKLKELNEETYLAVNMLIKAGKDYEATKVILKDLHAGGDNIDTVLSNFTAVHAAMGVALELITPLDYELKKS